MSRTLTAVKAGAVALALVATNLSAQEARLRSPGNGAADRAQANRAPSEQISNRPYAGSWSGSFTLSAAPRQVPMSVSLAAIEGSLDTYSGETTVARAAAFANAPISMLERSGTPPADMPVGPALPRTANPAMAPGASESTSGRVDASTAAMVGGPSNTASASAGSSRASGSGFATVEILDLSSGTAMLVPYRDGRPLLCDAGRRCVDMPLAKWEAKGLGGASWIYTATLVAKDKIEGTIAVKDGAAETQIGTFSLARQN